MIEVAALIVLALLVWRWIAMARAEELAFTSDRVEREHRLSVAREERRRRMAEIQEAYPDSVVTLDAWGSIVRIEGPETARERVRAKP